MPANPPGIRCCLNLQISALLLLVIFVSRKLMKILFSLALFCLVFTLQTANAQPLSLANNQQTSYVIALAADAIPAEKTAAEQLQKYLQQVTGAAFPIQPETQVNADAPQILVGAGPRVRSLLPAQDWNALGQDGIVIKTVGQNLILAGGRPRASLYAVFQFLEDEVGCRWWTPTASTIPSTSALMVRTQNITYVPPFNLRESFTTSVQSDPVFATMLRQNGHHQTQSQEWGGHYEVMGLAHTFGQLLPVEKYFKQHPEWYSDPANGYKPATASSKMPESRRTDLCLGNPEVLDAITEQALLWIDKNPDAGYISISQNDNTGGYCRDEYTVKLIEEEGSPSAPLIQFVNAVAERIHQKYPHIQVETLAYNYSEKPPKTLRTAPNVLVRLAPASSDHGNPINSDKNAHARDSLLAWSEKASQLSMWYYVTNFYNMLMPHPNMKNWATDLRFFADHKVKGVFAQGNAKTNAVGDFAALRTYVMSKLLWDPTLDQAQLTSDFLQGYYGEAAPFLKQYLELIDNSYPREKRSLYMYNRDYSFLTVDVLNRATALFDQAATAVAADPELAGRVARERFSLNLAWLMAAPHHQWDKEAIDREYAGSRDLKAALTQWKADAERFGVKAFTEGRPRGYIQELYPYLEQTISATPAQAEHYKKTGQILFTPPQFTLSKGYGSLVNDPLAGEGQAARVSGDNTAWAVQVWLGQWLPGTILEDARWKGSIRVRLDLKPGVTPKGVGIQTGIYNVERNREVQTQPVSLTQISAPGYHTIELKPTRLHGGMFIWVASDNNPAVEAVYIDSIVLSRQ